MVEVGVLARETSNVGVLARENGSGCSQNLNLKLQTQRPSHQADSQIMRDGYANGSRQTYHSERFGLLRSPHRARHEVTLHKHVDNSTEAERKETSGRRPRGDRQSSGRRSTPTWSRLWLTPRVRGRRRPRPWLKSTMLGWRRPRLSAKPRVSGRKPSVRGRRRPRLWLKPGMCCSRRAMRMLKGGGLLPMWMTLDKTINQVLPLSGAALEGYDARR